MGQYVVSLLEALNSEIGSSKVSIIFTSELPVKKELIKKIETIIPSAETASLPLLTMSQEKNTEKAIARNRQIIEDWLAQSGLKDVVFCIPALFQTEIYPVFPAKVKKCAISYDIIPLQMPGRYASVMRWEDYLYRFGELFSADKILCISKATSNAMQIYTGVPSNKLAVINGGPAIFPKSKAPKTEINKKFILMPTGNDLRKNNENAIRGFELFNQSKGRPYKLAITSVFSDGERSKLSELSQDVLFTGNVEDEELAWLYENSESVLFPSVLEGLGMPLLEAMVYDKPIVASMIEVFTEISEDAPYYFNPYDPTSISQALTSAVDGNTYSERRKLYKEILNTYSWTMTAKSLLKSIEEIGATNDSNAVRKRLAILCPTPSGISAVGKVVAEMHPTLSKFADIDYYFEPPTLNKELRPDIISAIAPSKHLSYFSQKRYESYDGVIYHIGNGNHHSMTATYALTMPGTVILHDLNLSGIFDDLLKNNIIDKNRYKIEEELNKRNGEKSKFITTIVNSQKSVIVHSDYADKIVKETLVDGSSVKIVRANLATHTPKYVINKKQFEGQFKIGLAGILANIKGLKVIEDIARDPLFRHDKILLFGLNFAEPGTLDRLRSIPNVIVETDLTDYEFQEKLKDLSIFVNFRTHYQGEASSATIEGMRYGVPVIVRSDFGWYSELLDDAVIKVAKEDDIAQTIVKYRESKQALKRVGSKAREYTQTICNPENYVEKIMEATNLIDR